MNAVRMLALLLLLIGLLAKPALAASLTATSATVGADAIATPRCTTAGLPVVPTISGTNVVSVTVSGIPSTCGGATLQAAVNNGITNSTGSATVPGGGGSVTVTLAIAVALMAGTQVDAVMVGP
jgi:hypothetical protein